MPYEPDNMVLVLLRDIRASQQRVEEKLDDFIHHVSLPELKVTQNQDDLAAHSARLDRIDLRLDRIEKRLDLLDI